MVALATQPQLPALSAEDKHLLRRYFALGQSVESLAAELASLSTQSSAPSTSSLDEFDLAAWTLSDPIAPHIAYRRAETQRARQERSLQTLETVLDAESPIERRRAATTILRTYANQLQRNRAAPPASPAAGTGGGRGARAAGGEGSVSTPSTDSSSFSRAHPIAALSNSASPHLPIPQSFSSSLAQPRRTPSPDRTEPEIIEHILDAIVDTDDPVALATAAAFISPDALIDDQPFDDPSAQLVAIRPQAEILTIDLDCHARHTPGPPETRTSITYISIDEGEHHTLRITLTRSPSGPHPNCWLVSRIDVNKDRDQDVGANTS